MGRLVAEGAIVVARTRPPLLVHAGAAVAARERAREVLRAAAGTGVPLAEFVARVVPDSGERLREFYLDDFRRTGVLRESAREGIRGRRRPARGRPRRAGGGGLPPGRLRGARRRARPRRRSAPTRRWCRGSCASWSTSKRLARVGGKWVLHREVLDEVVASLRGWGVERFDVAAFKERFGLTRKLAIPILEWLDSERVTRREGERRRMVRPRPGTTPGA